MNTIHVEVKTHKKQEMLEIETISTIDDMRKVLMRDVVHLKEDAIREALIRMGWTPPQVDE